MTVVASVVVPTYNPGVLLERQLRALANQRAPGELEVIVADNGSTDDTIAVARGCADALPHLRIVDASDRQGASHARNVGFDAATCDLILACDADDVVDEHWAGRLLDGLADADLVAGATVAWRAVGDTAPPTDGPTPVGPGFGGLGFYPVVIGSSFGVRRDVWRAVGGFDEGFPGAAVEDFDFAFRVQLAGYRFASRPDAFVYYRMPTSIRAAMRKYYAYGHFQPLLYRKLRARGMPRRSLGEVAKVWLRLAARSPELFGTTEERLRWCERFAHACGRIAGSVEFRTRFP